MRQNTVKALSDIEHVKQRPGMYVGSVQKETFNRWILNEETGKFEFREVSFVPGVLKMFDEIISNSIDEAFRTGFKFANQINVTVTDKSIIVRDNGRGIPVVKAEGSDVTQAEMALTQLRAGANFGDHSFVSIGTHGLGASLVNIMSKEFIAWTDDGKKRLSLVCKNGLETKLVRIDDAKRKDHGTYIEFFPDFSRFGCEDVSGDLELLIQKRVTDLAACFPNIEFRYGGVKVVGKKFKDYVAQIGDGAEILEMEKAKIAILTSDEPNQISFVNGIDTYEGGTHVDIVRHQVVQGVLERLNKQYKKLKLVPADIRNRLTIVVITNEVANPKFRSQTKEYVTNHQKDYAGILDGIADTNLIKRILKNPTIIDPIIETKKLKLEAAENVQQKAKERAGKKIKVAKHVGIARDANPLEATLYLTEGQSASGMLTDVRNPRKHGCYPLRGKPMNTFGKKQVDILKNKEMFELTSIMNLEHGKYDSKTLGYGKIAILADADHDGSSIQLLLLAYLARWPQLFAEKRVSIVRCPIMILKKGKQEIKIYDLNVYQDLVANGKVDDTWDLKYFKGLGSLTKELYEDMIHNPVEDFIELTDEDAKHLDMAFGPDPRKRKEWLLPGGVGNNDVIGDASEDFTSEM